METILLVTQVIVALLLIAIVMVQKTGADSVNNLSGGINTMSQTSTTGNFFTKTTATLAAIFMLNSLALSIVMDQKQNSDSIVEKIEHQEEVKKQDKLDLKKENKK